VEQVASVASSIALPLGLNFYLVMAGAFGHDVGHPPFGHEGERILKKICQEAKKNDPKNTKDLIPFQHNIQGLILFDRLELDLKKKRVNLTHETRDIIVAHNGEQTDRVLVPRPYLFPFLPRELREKYPTEISRREELIKRLADDSKQGSKWLRKQFEGFIRIGQHPKIKPFTLEGCLVRLSDRIAYLPTDLDEALRHGVVTHKLLEEKAMDVLQGLGQNATEMLHTLIHDVIDNSDTVTSPGYIGMSKEKANLLRKLYDFNYKYIYLNDEVKGYSPKVRMNLEILYRFFTNYSYKFIDFKPKYQCEKDVMSPREAINEIASMTDREALDVVDIIVDKTKIKPTL
jgi:dGTPase